MSDKDAYAFGFHRGLSWPAGHVCAGVNLFGPPGAGKSMILGSLAFLRVPGIDLEVIDPAFRGRAYAAASFKAMAIAMADVSLPQIREQAEVLRGAGIWRVNVLVLPSERAYRVQRGTRDEREPWKTGQGDWYPDFAGSASAYGATLQPASDHPLATASLLCASLRGLKCWNARSRKTLRWAIRDSEQI